MLELETFAGFILVITLTVGASMMLKLGAAEPLSQRTFSGFFGWRSAAGVGLFGCSGLVYALLLQSVPLNLAQAFAVTQLAGVALVASCVLGGSISALRWLGIAFIFCSIPLMGLAGGLA